MPPQRAPRNRNNQRKGEGNDQNPINQLTDVLTEVVQQHTIRNPKPLAHQGVTFKEFKAVGPPEFKGTSEPIEAQGWITEIEKAFVVANVSEHQKTILATYMLKEEANFWWEANQTRAGPGVVVWEKFKELFFENYFPKSMQSRMELRFLELKQGDMTVSQYAVKFNKLARFAPHQVDTEDRKTRRFEYGLKPWLFNKLAFLQVETFAQILEKAIIAEGGTEALIKYNMEKKGKDKEEKAKVNESGSSKNHKRKRGNGNKQGGVDKEPKRIRNRVESCNICGKNHTGECLMGRNSCYRCKQMGHMAPDCPSLKKNNGCYTCRKVGHLSKNCPKKSEEEQRLLYMQEGGPSVKELPKEGEKNVKVIMNSSKLLHK